MTQEEKKLLLIDLSARLPYGVKMWFPSAFAPFVLDEFILNVARKRDENFKPYLRPLSSMTEEEEKEYENCFQSDDTTAATLLVDFYNKHHFDYRGLIEKGLALEAPANMYKTE